MGRNKFGPQRGPWEDHDWHGWWGDVPPFHTPVFVLTHHLRPSFTLDDTTFHFLDAAPAEALTVPRRLRSGKDVRLGGGVATVREFLDADLVDTMHVAMAPVEFGRGERLWNVTRGPARPVPPREGAEPEQRGRAPPVLAPLRGPRCAEVDVENAPPGTSMERSPHGGTIMEEATMATTELQAIVRFRFHDGDVEEFKRLSAQCMEIVRAQDTGTLQYDTYFNDDETECIVIERFRDSDALIDHGENLAHLMDAIIATGSVSGELLGDLSTELRARFAEGGPVQLFAPWSRM